MKFILKGCKEGLSKVTKIRNFMKFMKTAKFTIICLPIQEIYEIYSKGYKEVPNNSCKGYEIYENCEIYENLPVPPQNIWNLFKVLLESPQFCKIYENLREFQSPSTKSEIFSKGCKEGPSKFRNQLWILQNW